MICEFDLIEYDGEGLRDRPFSNAKQLCLDLRVVAPVFERPH
jgi:hypothetical protein